MKSRSRTVLLGIVLLAGLGVVATLMLANSTRGKEVVALLGLDRLVDLGWEEPTVARSLASERIPLARIVELGIVDSATGEAALEETEAAIGEGGVLLEGWVFGPDGAPVSGARIDLAWEAPHGFRALQPALHADTEGHFKAVLFIEETERLQVLARSPELAPALIDVPYPPSSSVELELSQGGEIIGRVLDGRGQALVGAQLDVRPTRASVASWHFPDDGDVRKGQSLADGQFQLRGLPLGVELSLVARAEAHAARCYSDLRLDAETKELEVRLQGAVPFPGKVLDRKGEPISMAQVGCTTDEGLVISEAVTAPDGSFELSGVGSGEWTLWAGAVGYAREQVPVTLPLASNSEVVVTLLATGAIHGRVLDAEGPYTVTALPVGDPSDRRRKDQTFEALEFQLESLSPGEYELRAAIPGGVPVSYGNLHIDSGGVTQMGDLTVRHGAAVFGRVVQKSDGAPVAARLILKLVGYKPGSLPSTGTDEAGSFRFEGVEADAYYMYVDVGGGLGAATMPLFTTDGTTPFDLGTFFVPEPWTIRVRVLGYQGEPLSGVAVTTSSSSGGLGSIGVGTGTDLNGYISLQGIDLGKITVNASLQAAPQFSVSSRVEVREGQTTDCVIDLSSLDLREVRFTALREGRTQHGLYITLAATDKSWSSRAVETEAGGTYTFAGVGPGPASMRFFRDGKDKTVEVPSAHDLPSEYELPELVSP